MCANASKISSSVTADLAFLKDYLITLIVKRVNVQMERTPVKSRQAMMIFNVVMPIIIGDKVTVKIDLGNEVADDWRARGRGYQYRMCYLDSCAGAIRMSIP